MSRKMPLVKPRRLYDEDQPSGYYESDQDYFDNNHDVILLLLERELKRQYKE